jgi:general secretion pathway protein D
MKPNASRIKKVIRRITEANRYGVQHVSLRPHIIFLTLLIALLSGCADMPFHKHDTPDIDSSSSPTTPLPKISTVDDEKPIKIKTTDTALAADAKIEKGNGTFVNEKAARLPAPGTAVPSADGQITFNFENQPIQAVVQAILGALLKENYTIAPNVTGNVTFSTSRPITPEQAMPILEMLLAWTNNALVRKEGRYEVLPVKDAIPGNLTPRIAAPNIAKGYEVRVFPLKYISATEMQKLLKPFAKADAVVSADAARNMMIMAGTASELANYERTIDVFDVDWLKGMSVGVYSLRNSDVSKVQPELDKIFGDAGQSPLAGMFRFISMDSTNSIVVITSQPEYLKQAEQWLYRLDLGAGENGTQLYVYDVKNVKAVDLSDHLNAIYTGQVQQKSNTGNVAPGLKATTIGGANSGNGLGGSLAGNTLNSSSRTNGSYGSTTNSTNRTATGGVTGTGSGLSTTGTGTPNANGQKPTDIRITAIEENNQLLVMATPGEWDSILAAIHRLDISPLQVQIEAKILEVTLTGDLQFGVQWWLAGLINTNTAGGANQSATGYQYNYNLGGGALNGVNSFEGNAADRHRASLGGTGVNPNGGQGLFYSFLNKNFQVALNTLQTTGQTKVLSAPSLVVMNNQQAQITVGTQVPIISTSIVGIGTTDTTGLATNTGIGQASYISTGITLSVTPRVNPGGLVYMDVDQEDSIPGAAATAGGNPPISQRNLQTEVAVQSGETVLLGGMIQDQTTDSKSGIPVLSSIPVLGNLFGNSDKTHTRTELIVLITPRVVVNADDARDMTQEYEKKFESLVPIKTAKPPASTVAQPIAVPEPAPATPPTPLPEPKLPSNLKDRPNGQ